MVLNEIHGFSKVNSFFVCVCVPKFSVNTDVGQQTVMMVN